MDYYYFPWSHWSRFTSLALSELGLEPTRHLVDIRANANFAPDYMRINNKGVVPTLVDGATTITEAANIARYLDRLTDHPPLTEIDGDETLGGWLDKLTEFPMMLLSYSVWIQGRRGEQSRTILADKIERAFRYADQYPDLAEAYRKKGVFFRTFAKQISDSDYVAAVCRDCRTVLDDMADVVANTTWLAGPRYTLADAAATAILYRLVDLPLLDEWSKKPDHPLSRYQRRLQARPSFSAVFVDDPLIDEL